ncbi:MAG: hypothetical protein WED05_05740 [Candidatus Atabeyarchaeum deiterrae]
MDEVAGATLILAFVTFLLVVVSIIDTSRILKDDRKGRQIKWVEHRIAELYYPLNHNMGDSITLYAFMPSIENKLYLAEPDLRKALEEFRNSNISIRTIGGMLTGEILENEEHVRDLNRVIKNLVKSQLEGLQGQLDNLTGAK